MYLLGNISGVIGVIICIASLAARIIGDVTLLEVRAINLFIVGTGFMVLGCFAKLSGR